MSACIKDYGVKRILAGICILSMLILPEMTGADESAVAEIQAVYGGRITSISVIELSNAINQSRIFISTESANSIFYGDVDHSTDNLFSTNNFFFSVVPDFDAKAGMGTVNAIAGHEQSGQLFITHEDGLLSCAMTANTLVTNITSSTSPQPAVTSRLKQETAPGPVNFITLLIKESVLLTIGGSSPNGTNKLFFGTITADGTFSQSTVSPVSIGVPSTQSFLAMVIHPVNNCVYILDCDGTNGIRKSSSAYNALSELTTFSTILLPPASTSWTARKELGIGPDGRLFVGSSITNKIVAYSDNDGTSWTVVDTSAIGTGGGNIATIGDTNAYNVYYGTAASTNKGVNGSWSNFPLGGTAETHPNDGEVKVDPLNNNILYMTTDQGIGTSTNAGVDLFEIDQGVEAVQVQDFDMTDAKDVAWAASKSGIRRATGFPDNPQWTQNGMFPLGNGSPYYSVAVDRSDPSGLTAYAANNRIYKTTDGGSNWTCCYQAPEGANSEFYFSALEVNNDVFAGIYYNVSGYLGGLLYSADGGNTWTNRELGTDINGVNVNDIVLVTENGTNVAYIAAAYDTNSASGGHVYRVTLTNSTHVSLSTDPVSIRDLAVDLNDNSIYASGMTTNNEPVFFYKEANGSTWTALTTTGLPDDARPMANPNWRGPVISVGEDPDPANNDHIPIIAVGIQLYALPKNGAKWLTSSSMAYPEGTQINVLYWDELMVGTDTGIYGQEISLDTSIVVGDFDGDGKADVAVYQEATGYWYVQLSGSSYALSYMKLGESGYTPVPADYDGDSKADVTVYHEATGYWYIQLSGSSYALSYQKLGEIGYTPIK